MAKQKTKTKEGADDSVDRLTISPEKVCFLIVKAREFDAKEAVDEPDPGSNPSDDKDVEVLEDYGDDPGLMCFLEEQRTLSEPPLKTCGEARRKIQDEHRRKLLTWLQEQFQSGTTIDQVSVQLAL